MSDTLTTIGDLRMKKPGLLSIAIIGGNASALDLLFHLALADLDDYEVTVISPSGLPALLYVQPGDSSDWHPPHLSELARSLEPVTCDDIEVAFRNDIDQAKRTNDSLSTSLAAINTLIVECVSLLAESEKQKFASTTGVNIGRLTRRTTPEMAQCLAGLRNSGRLHEVEGRFKAVVPTGSQHEVYWSTSGSEEHLVADLVVNCTGPGDALVRNSPLLTSMNELDLITFTDCARGIKIDHSLTASPGIWVLGPLLAGNVLNNDPVWHIEHAGRILEHATRVADLISSSMSPLPTD